MSTRYAFKCRECGTLEEPGNAGERAVPAACRICGAGVSFDPRTGAKAYDEGNWLVLADLPADELAPIREFHGIARKDVTRHTPEPSTATREPAAIDRSTSDGLGSEDRP